ncbi:MAG: T9SS type A sorting domain-containing protein, partial [Chitinophagaceae bacterium]
GSLSNEAPILLLKLSDSSGINTGSGSINHDIVATLDNNNDQYFVLNNFYESDLDSYQRGTVRFQLPALPPGPHTLTIKAWDVVNNSAETVLSFIVANNERLTLSRVLNYPNPFTTNTAFWFEHNQPGVDLYCRVEIFTVAGKQIKTLNRTINTPGNRSFELSWDGRDEWGDKIGRGIYIYRLSVKTAHGKTASQWGKLALLQ